MDDFGMGYALGQDSGSSCRDGGSGMWGGDGSWIFAFLIIALIFGGRGGLFGGGWGGNSGGYGDGINSPAGQGALTRGDLCSEFNFNNLDNAVRGIQQGLCDGFYAMNSSLMNGFHGVDNAICNLGYQTQQGFNTLGSQMAQCCCDTQRAIDNVNFTTLQGLMGFKTRFLLAAVTPSVRLSVASVTLDTIWQRIPIILFSPVIMILTVLLLNWIPWKMHVSKKRLPHCSLRTRASSSRLLRAHRMPLLLLTRKHKLLN